MLHFRLEQSSSGFTISTKETNGHLASTQELKLPWRIVRLLTMTTVTLTSLLAGAKMVRAENPDHIRQLLATNECENCDLSDSNLIGLDLREANLQGSQLAGANLTNTQLSRANLQGANLSQAILTGANFQGANLANAVLEDADISDSCGDFFGAMMLGAVSDDASCVSLKLMQILGPDFCDPSYWADVDLDLWSAANLCGEGDDLALFNPFFGKLFSVPNFQGVNFSNADLTGVSFTTADLRYATLTGATLDDTQFDFAVLIDAVVEESQSSSFSQALSSEEDIANLIIPLFRQQAIAANQSAAQSNVGAMNRAQQAYYLEYEEFSKTVPDLQIGIPTETGNYRYGISQTSPTMTVQTAVSTRDDLNSYLGIVYLQNTEMFEDTMTTTALAASVAVLCVSNLPKTPIPENISVPSLPPSDGTEPQVSVCPDGFYDYQTGTSGTVW